MNTVTASTKPALTAKRPAVVKAKAEGVSMSQLVKVLRTVLPAELKAHGGKLPLKEVDAVADALARQVVGLVVYPGIPKERKAPVQATEEWITTQEAANRCGFSRPFVTSLLDSGAYKGRVNRTTGGHRKVLASEFEALMAQASANAPKTMTQARKTVDLTRLDEGAAVAGTARKQSRARARALAKKLGLTA